MSLENEFPETVKIFLLYRTRQDGKLKEWKNELEILQTKIFHLLERYENATSNKKTFNAKILKEQLEVNYVKARELDAKIHERIKNLLITYNIK